MPAVANLKKFTILTYTPTTCTSTKCSTTTVHESSLTARIRTELYDFQLGTASTTDEIRLPADFVVQETMCEACTAEP